jgi:hypothetical protein
MVYEKKLCEMTYCRSLPIEEHLCWFLKDGKDLIGRARVADGSGNGDSHIIKKVVPSSRRKAGTKE